MSGWSLPRSLEVGGQARAIHADYRDALEILQRLDDPDEDERERVYVCLALFYDRFEEIPPVCWRQALEKMLWFLGGGQEQKGPAGPRLVDWQQDEAMIVADINRVAGCEVRALPFCHWWTFLSWYGAIGQGQLAAVVSIRDRLRRGKKLDDWQKEYYRMHKAQVELKKRYTAAERAEQQRLKQLLGE